MSPSSVNLAAEAGGPPLMYRPSKTTPSHPDSTINANGFMVVDNTDHSPKASRGPISPPPLRRTSSSFIDHTDHADSPSAPNPAQVTTKSQAATTNLSRHPTSQADTPGSQRPQMSQHSPTQPANAPLDEWTVPRLVSELEKFQQETREAHAHLVAFSLESAKIKDHRVHHGNDLFADLVSTSVDPEKEATMRIKFKQHFTKTKKDNREEHHKAIGIKTTVSRVPGYRYHHVGIKKNILAPNTPLLFTPHLRDLDSNQEAKYHDWLRDLETQDVTTGFTPMQREEKYKRTIQKERTRYLAMFIDQWLERLGIPHCGKLDLIKYILMETSNTDHASRRGPVNRDSYQEDADLDWYALGRFGEAFDQVFGMRQPDNKKIKLRDVILPDGSADLALPSPTARGGPESTQEKAATGNGDTNSKHVIDAYLETYSLLGCLICFSHDCEHGEYAPNNDKTSFAYGSGQRSITYVLKKRARLEETSTDQTGRFDLRQAEECSKNCYIRSRSPSRRQNFSVEERSALHAVIATSNTTSVTLNPVCMAAKFLDRYCDAVFLELQEMDIAPAMHRGRLPDPQPVESVSWYDRHKKILVGDWQDHLGLAEEREMVEPCCHEGPCVRGQCTCVDQGVLCDKFCDCGVENCAFKFTGCACQSVGKSCQHGQNEKPHCICVQLQRECDPDLCGSCGALERADPFHSRNDVLHSTGCQNVAVQRGLSKTLLLGQSQLHGIMYGLFAGEDIAEGQFIIEYVGELISHDEGERRGQRRSDVFSDTGTPSYLFELLKKDCLYVDAAVYGNLSRYINHAGDREKDQRNIMPRVVYVKGDYRIKFMASRDIKAGEELFFDYGENFPEVSNFVNSRDGDQKAGTKRRRGRPLLHPRDANGQAKRTQSLPKSRKRRRFEPNAAPDGQSTAESDWETGHSTTRPAKRRRHKRDGDVATEHADPADKQPRFASPLRKEGATDSDAGRTRARGAPGRTATEGQPVAGPPKIKGKRGGARPGSGRPRKHPRPGEEVGGTPKKGKTTKQKNKAKATRDETEVALEGQLADIEEDMQARVTPSPKSAGSPSPADIYMPPSSPMVQDSDDDDDDDDDDIIIRSRDRMSRQRRPPAKYRTDEEIWG